MTIPKRFTLSTLLLVMLLVSLVFGYAQWRRQQFIEEIRRLNEDGSAIFSNTRMRAYEFHTPISVTLNDSFWLQVIDQPIMLVVFKNTRGEYYFDGQEPKPVEEVKELLSSLQRRLRSVGITSAKCAIVFPRTADGQTMTFIKIESLGTEVEPPIRD